MWRHGYTFTLFSAVILFGRPARAFLPPPLRHQPSKDALSLSKSTTTSTTPLTHADILWKIRPDPPPSRWRRVVAKLSAWGILLDCKLTRQPTPTLLFPKKSNGQVVLEAWHERQKIGWFGITIESGPCIPAIQESVQQLYPTVLSTSVRTAAIIYMVVDEQMRGRNVGTLALEAIRFIHAVQQCDFTILVADDKSSDKTLVSWYERFGYVQAPLLQEPLGSPNQVYGITMMAPTDTSTIPDIQFQWW